MILFYERTDSGVALIGTLAYPEVWTGRPSLRDFTEARLQQVYGMSFADLRNDAEYEYLIPTAVRGSRLWAAVDPATATPPTEQTGTKVRNYMVDDELNRDWLKMVPKIRQAQGGGK
jgi:hypothetical protein